MAVPYVGEIRMFAGNFAPAGWMLCEGQLISIAENETLFNLIGTTYGGDGQETFALPDLRGRVPIHYGKNITGSDYLLAETGGVESVTLNTQQIPTHTHSLIATTDLADTGNPGNAQFSTNPTGSKMFSNSNPTLALNPTTITPSGGNQAHTNLQPYLCVNFIISLFGLFPST
ncbi:phage tail protein [Flavobacterium hibernum]|uniref:Phage tail protein n=1 Tax=Flavobacterium hibernum TaxID=37752 RepID=A0A0D0ESB9_9FLAO|nr:tail fiber protein [Flavobacterium hibernum]KIO51203.1 tail collar protein [Flavobacterium hibernum]OXA86271.1 phage tail protein [Flavobacterium hibernum]PTS93326.1 phage tail protein [Flavobacterium sp. HMWF030]STO14477.1 Phage Tail Collar Domain [Flavobacterium hibernum]